MLFLLAFASLASAQTTPNLGFNIPPYNFPNWQIPINANFSQLDLMLSGNFTLPAFSVTALYLPSLSNGCIDVSGGTVASTGSACGTSSDYTLSVNGTSLTAGDTVNFNATTPAAPTNGINVTFATSRSSTTDSLSAAVVGDGNSAHFLNGTGTYTTPPGSGITGSGTANTFPLWSSSSAIGNSLLTEVTSPNGINYSLGSGNYIQLDASHLSFSSAIVGSSNITIANTYNAGGGNNAGGIILEGAPTSGSASAGSAYVYGGQNGSGSDYGEVVVGGGAANGSGYVGGNVLVQAGAGTGGNGDGQVELNDLVGNFTQSAGNGVETGFLTSKKFGTSTYCASSASPAACSSASAGFVAVPTGSSPTLVVDTTAVDANSQIFLQNDSSLGTALSITCNSTAATLAVPAYVSARSTGTSFTITYSGTISTNDLCISYNIVN
jgi:hypothetical protein